MATLLKRSKKPVLFAAVALVLVAPLFALFRAEPAQAAPPEGWINRWSINFEGKTWIDSNPYDANRQFQGPQRSDGCQRDKIVFPGTNVDGGGFGDFYYNNFPKSFGGGSVVMPAIRPESVHTYVPSPTNISSGCSETVRRDGITFQNTNNRRLVFYLTADDKVVNMHNGSVFVRVSEFHGSAVYARAGEEGESCRDLIVARPSHSLNEQDWFTNGDTIIRDSWTLYAVRDAATTGRDVLSETYRSINPSSTDPCQIEYAGDTYVDITQTGYGMTTTDDDSEALVVNGFDTNGNPVGGNGRDDAFAIFVGTVDNITPTPSGGGGGPGNPNQCLIPGLSHLNKDDPGCKAEAPVVCTVGETGLSSALAWIICPLTALIADVTQFVEKNLIIPYLTVNPLKAEGSDGQPTVIYRLWDSFRNIANVVLVIVFFVIIFATAAGNFNYGIKRLLPRFFMIAIGANLIFFGAALAIDAFNLFGRGIEDLFASTILQPLQSDPYYSNAYPGGPSTGQIFALGAVLLGAIAFTGGGALGWLFGLLMAAVLIIFVAVIVLILRQMLILALVIVSPLAMVAYLLPNTEKYATKWMSMLIQLLAMYPLIIMLFAAGKIMGTLFASPELTPIVAPVGGAPLAQPLVDTVRVVMMFLAFVLPLGLLPFVFMATGGLISKAYGAMRNAAQQGGKALGDSDRMKELKGRLANRAALNPTLGKLAGTGAGRFGLGVVGYGQARRRKVISTAAAYTSTRNKDIQAEFEAAGISGDKGRLETIATDNPSSQRGQAAIQQLAALGGGDQLYRIKKAIIKRQGSGYMSSPEYKNFSNTVAREGGKALAKTPDLLDVTPAASENGQIFTDPATFGKMGAEKTLDMSHETIRRILGSKDANGAETAQAKALRDVLSKAKGDPNLKGRFSAEQAAALNHDYQMDAQGNTVKDATGKPIPVPYPSGPVV